MSATLKINEIYQSIQGESTWAGLPCIFIRLTGCDLRCTYCDTEYAFFEGKKREVDEILTEVLSIDCPLVEITGGSRCCRGTSCRSWPRSAMPGGLSSSRPAGPMIFQRSTRAYTASWI